MKNNNTESVQEMTSVPEGTFLVEDPDTRGRFVAFKPDQVKAIIIAGMTFLWDLARMATDQMAAERKAMEEAAASNVIAMLPVNCLNCGYNSIIELRKGQTWTRRTGGVVLVDNVAVSCANCGDAAASGSGTPVPNIQRLAAQRWLEAHPPEEPRRWLDLRIPDGGGGYMGNFTEAQIDELNAILNRKVDPPAAPIATATSADEPAPLTTLGEFENKGGVKQEDWDSVMQEAAINAAKGEDALIMKPTVVPDPASDSGF